MLDRVKRRLDREKRKRAEAKEMALLAHEDNDHAATLAFHPETRTGLLLEKLGLDGDANRALLADARDRLDE